MRALLIIDLQNDFLPKGALTVSKGDEIITVINELQSAFDLIIATKDWHPANHGSFASNHQNEKVGNVINLNGIEQILWSAHCIQNSFGAELSLLLNKDSISKIILKGTDSDIDSYSAFFDNNHQKSTGLHQYLKENNVDELFVTGLATDYCVYFTVKDALQLGYKTWLVTDAVKGVNINPSDSQKAICDMEKSGAKLITSKGILKI